MSMNHYDKNTKSFLCIHFVQDYNLYLVSISQLMERYFFLDRLVGTSTRTVCVTIRTDATTYSNFVYSLIARMETNTNNPKLTVRLVVIQ